MKYALVALTLGLVGCGAGPNPAASDEEVGTARVEIVTAMPSGQADTFRSTGIVDFANDRTEYVDEPTGCRSISIGGVLYTERPEDESGDGKRWLRTGDLDTEKLFEESLEQTTSADGRHASVHIVFFSASVPYPDRSLKELRAVSGEKPEPVGRDEVRGVSTTRHRVTLEVKERTRRELEAAGWRTANIDRYLQDFGGGTEEIEVWVGADGLARRVVSRTTWPGDEFFTASRTVSTTEFFDFGVEADIDAPPAEDVLEEREWWRSTREQQEKELEERFEGQENEDEGEDSAEEEPPPSCLH